MNNLAITRMLNEFRNLTIAIILIVGCASAADFDRDGKADLAVFRPSTSTWHIKDASSEVTASQFRWGQSTDVLVPADYDGDGQTDIAVWRPSTGVWYINQSADESVLLVRWGMTTQHPTGGLPDVPVPADFDGDKLADLAVWRPDTGEWWVLRSSNGYDQNAPLVYRWGKLGDVPVQADYDGDGVTDLAVFRTTENRWYIRESKTGQSSVQAFGLSGLDTLVPADYTGDGKSDIAVYRSGVWYVLNSETLETETFHFGFNDDVPVPADFDGDGTVDYAVYRSGTWYIYESSRPRLRSFDLGQVDDVPVNSGVVRQSIVAVP